MEMEREQVTLPLFSRLSWFLILACLMCVAPANAYSNVEKEIEAGLTVELEHGKKIYMRGCPIEDCDADEWAARLLANPENQARFTTGGCLKAPLAELAEEYQLEAIQTIFKDDSYDQKGWIHKVTYTSSRRGGGETLWSISRWFTGDPRNYTKIMQHNRMSSRSRLYKGTTVRIPLALLSPAFKEPILSDIAARRALQSFSAESKRLNGDLMLKTDSQGPYASYQLKKGDTIYSKVVMKFTDRVTPEDVMEAVRIICDRSSIKKPRRLKAGDEVKVPLDLLSPMYLPRDDPRRLAYERLKQEAESYSNPVRTADLLDIIVILDPGHGGNDPGTTGRNGIYEDEVVYDILCRIKRLLESTTMAQVIPTVIDKSEQYEPKDLSYFPNDTDEYVLTNPVYRNHSSKVSVNLRWYLVNSIFRKVTAEGADPDKVVFVSLHADSLYHEARGTMIYIPGTYFCRGNGGKSGYVYTSRSEVREKQFVQIPYRTRVRSEGLSGNLAKHLIDSCSRYNIRVHSEKPIRNHVIRRRRAWVPAVIRHNIVPTKILVEVANLNNSQDCSLASDPAFRERYARAFVDALKEYYGGK
jgi:N-acetylmuramoyl-L-alanine amidase